MHSILYIYLKLHMIWKLYWLSVLVTAQLSVLIALGEDFSLPPCGLFWAGLFPAGGGGGLCGLLCCGCGCGCTCHCGCSCGCGWGSFPEAGTLELFFPFPPFTCFFFFSLAFSDNTFLTVHPLGPDHNVSMV